MKWAVQTVQNKYYRRIFGWVLFVTCNFSIAATSLNQLVNLLRGMTYSFLQRYYLSVVYIKYFIVAFLDFDMTVRKTR